MSKPKLRKIQGGGGGRDAVKMVTDFLNRKGQDSVKFLQHKTSELATWSVPLSPDEELEITLEGLKSSVETTLYMGINIIPVPLQKTQEFLTTVLSVADTLIGAKLSLVNYDVVISTTEYVSSMRGDEIDYIFELLTRQKDCVLDEILETMSKKR